MVNNKLIKKNDIIPVFKISQIDQKKNYAKIVENIKNNYDEHNQRNIDNH